MCWVSFSLKCILPSGHRLDGPGRLQETSDGELKSFVPWNLLSYLKSQSSGWAGHGPHTPLILALRRLRPDSGNQTSNPATATGKLLTDLTRIPVRFIDQYRLIYLNINIDIFFLMLLLLFWDKVCLYSLGCPGTHSVDQIGLDCLRDAPASASMVLELKTCTTTASLKKLIKNY